MFSMEDLFDDSKGLDDLDFNSLLNSMIEPAMDFWKSELVDVKKKTVEENKLFVSTLKDHEVISTDTVLGNTNFTYFNSSEKPLRCIIPDVKAGEIRCMGLMSSEGYPVTIITRDKKEFTINKENPFLNLFFVKDVGYVENIDNLDDRKMKHFNR